jgi:hypothetical protein
MISVDERELSVPAVPVVTKRARSPSPSHSSESTNMTSCGGVKAEEGVRTTHDDLAKGERVLRGLERLWEG